MNTLNKAFVEDHSSGSIQNCQNKKNQISFEFRDNMDSYYDDMSSDINFEVQDHSKLKLIQVKIQGSGHSTKANSGNKNPNPLINSIKDI